MNRYTLTAEIHHIGKPEQITEKLTKQVVVLKSEENNRVEYIPFDIYNDSVTNLSVGETVTIEFKLKGKASKNDGSKYFGSNQVIQIIK
jgi:hypothetical protein